MPVPLAWLAAQPDLGLRQLTGSSEGVMLTWAHAIELDDPSPWLAGGELVLTTGLRMPRALAEQAAYVDRLATARVAALAFGVGVRYAEVPRGIVVRCTEIGLPLLEVPLPTPFVAITQRVAQRLAEEQQELLQRAVTFQQALTRRTLREGSRGLVAGLSKELSAPVALLDEHLRPLAVSSRARALVGAATAALEQAPSDRSLRVSQRTEVGGQPFDLHPLAGRTAHRGWLVVALETPGPHERLLVNHAVSLATLHLDRPRELEEARAQVGATVLALLLEHAPAEPAVVRHLHHLGFSPGAAVRVLSIQTPRPLPEASRAAMATALTTAGVPNALVRTTAGVVLLVPDRDVSGALAHVQEGAAGAGSGALAIGVSAAVAADRSAHALVQARSAARTARRERKPVEWFDALTLEAILDDEGVRERVQALSSASLAPLLEAPSGPDRDLVATLSAFLEHNGSWEAASRALGVHRHTLRNRISRVEELTGLSLDVAHHRVVLTLALATLPPT